jgi:membrane protease subunit (stomatin/prohibitin family)
MSLFQSANPKEEVHKGFLGQFSVDNIKWEPGDDSEASFVCVKYPYEDFPNGSYLHVSQSQIAIFINNYDAGIDGNGGESQVSIFTGPCKEKLDTGDSRFAPFRNVTHALTGGSSQFHCLVYFVNTTYMNELKWGTVEPILVQDPEEEVNIHVSAYGLYGAHIEAEDKSMAPVYAEKFLKRIVGTRDIFTRDELISFMRAKILEYVPDLLAKEIVEQNIGILKLPAKISELSTIIKVKLVENFSEFGLTLDNFSFNSIKPREEDLAAINEMKIQRKRAQFEAEGNAAKMDIESAARQRMREREGFTYQEQRGFDVMQDAASNESNISGGIMGAGMGLGMGVGVGGAVGAGFSNLADQTINKTLGNDKTSQPSGNTVKCPKCGHENPAGAKFCLECGSKIESVVVCPKCGHENPAGAKFCLECGTSLTSHKCPNCGAELEPGAKFCMNCGTKIGD